MSGKYIQASTAAERVIHWVLAISCLLLVISGLGFMFHDLSFIARFFGGHYAMKMVHEYLGIVFGISLLFSLFTWSDAAKFNSDDAAWISVGGGYLKKDVEIPEVGRYNAGQKLFFVFLILFGGLVFATGLAMWFPFALPKELVRWAYPLHVLSLLALVPFIVVHIYLGSIGAPGGIQAMTIGYVAREWAKKHHPGWVKEVDGQS
jgi:formate dehydrogenase subunit gamma